MHSVEMNRYSPSSTLNCVRSESLGICSFVSHMEKKVFLKMIWWLVLDGELSLSSSSSVSSSDNWLWINSSSKRSNSSSGKSLSFSACNSLLDNESNTDSVSSILSLIDCSSSSRRAIFLSFSSIDRVFSGMSLWGEDSYLSLKRQIGSYRINSISLYFASHVIKNGINFQILSRF